ncbi:MAG: hypothetical protein QOE59_4545 [Actinomycetota bacterium]|jgi:hypothetical protein|nr:hypothetical protein [Actinomycetota bacterium]
MNELSDDEPTTDRPGTTGPSPTGAGGPGSPGALRDGCRCSVLLNRAVGQGPDDDHPEFVNPLCPVHGSLGTEREPDRDPDVPVRS